jgi:hypothetical protein
MAIESPEHQKRNIEQYFLGQSPPETEISHLEKISSRSIMGRRHEIWDVHSSDGRWWVITEMTNLYSQERFPSADECLTFHVGLMIRLMDRERSEGTENPEVLPEAWRRHTRAVEACDEADEAEDFQTVGVRCREALLAVVRETADDSMVPSEQDRPKAADFKHWSELLANHYAAGASNARLRSYIKATSKEAWEYTNWLTHARNVGRWDAEIALDMTSHVLNLFSSARMRFEAGLPDRCPVCGSYRLAPIYDWDLLPHWYTLCEACDWRSEQRHIGDRDKDAVQE